MKHNIKYGVVAALTMAAFVAPSVAPVVSAYSETTTDNEKSITITATDAVTKVGWGSSYDTTNVKSIDYDGDDKLTAIKNALYFEIKNGANNKVSSHKVSEYSNLNIVVKKSGAWKIAGALDASATAYEIAFTAESGNADDIIDDDKVFTADGDKSIKVKVDRVQANGRSLTVVRADGKELAYKGTSGIALSELQFKLGSLVVTPDTDTVKVYNSKGEKVANNKMIEAGTYTITADITEDNENFDIDGKWTNKDSAGGSTVTTKEYTAKVTVAKASIANGALSFDDDEIEYNGEAVYPVVSVTAADVSNATITDNEGKVVTAQKDNFAVSFSNNTKVGTATVTVTGKGNYTGTLTKTFKVKAGEIASTVSASTSYTGSAVAPAKIGSFADGFTVSFDSGVDHTNVGTGIPFTVKGDGKNLVTSQTGVEGKLEIKQLVINITDDEQVFTNTAKAKKYSLENDCITVVLSSKAFGVKPAIKAIYAEGNEVSTSLYSVSKFEAAASEGDDAEITLAGDATAVAKGNIAAEGSVKYKTVGVSISDATISGIAKAYTYNGNTKEPTPVVTLNGEKLVEGTDYVVSYKNNVKVGTATVVVTGAGDYSGSVTKSFYIDPAKSSIKKIATGAKKMTVTVKKGTAASGVQIAYRVKGTTKWSYKKTTSTSATISSLKKGKKYQVVVRSYTTKSGKVTNYSGWSATKTTAKIK